MYWWIPCLYYLLTMSCVFVLFFFPRYPDSWYEEITSNPRFYSLAATHQARIIGLVVAELKPQNKLNKEVWSLILSLFNILYSICWYPLFTYYADVHFLHTCQHFKKWWWVVFLNKMSLSVRSIMKSIISDIIFTIIILI